MCILPAHVCLRAGWVLSHNARRLDLADFQRLLDALAAQVATGRPLERWQLKVAQRAWYFQQRLLRVSNYSHERE